MVSDLWFDETKEMIKRILRAAVGVVFFFVFFVFLLTSAVKFRILSATFWKTAMDKGGVYLVLQNKMGAVQSQMEESIRKGAGSGAVVPKGMAELLSIPEQLTTDRFRELIETNLDRLVSYLDGKDKNLILFLPIKEWSLPVAALGQPALLQLTGQTPLEQAMVAIGYKSEQSAAILKGLEQFKMVVGYLPAVWFGLLLLAVLLLAGHYFLGVGLADRIGGTAWLLLICGFVAKLVGVGGESIFKMMATNSKPPMEPWLAELGKSLAGQFFNLGATLGLVLGVVGLIVVIGVIYLTKTGKIKEEKENISLKKKVFAFGLGVTLGFVVLGAVLVGTVMASGGSVNLGSKKETVTEEPEQRLTDDAYKSDKGWEIKFPAGWKVVKGEKSEGVIKKPVSSAADWATIEVSSLTQGKVIDSGNYLKLFKESIAAGKSGLENAVLAEDPYEERQEETGLTRFVFIIDFDGVVAGNTVRQRYYMVEYRTESGVGFVIKARVPVESWGKYEKIIKESVDTFRVEGL